MKTSVASFIVVLLFVVAGCTENGVEPIVAQSPGKVTTAPQKLELNQKIEFDTPEGAVVSANLEGEITYQMTKVDPASMSKEIPNPSRDAYRVTLIGQGEMALQEGNASASLQRPIVWTFMKSLTEIVEEGGEFTATFPIVGTKYQIAHLHLGFVLARTTLVQDLASVDFHANIAE